MTMKNAQTTDSQSPEPVTGVVLQRLVRHYFGREVTATKTGEDWHPYPWTYTINDNGTLHSYVGLPNKCETPQSALKRAWWRCKWMSEGTYGNRYKVISA